jgi:glycosyltransferase involved in cell wall biosynthesis
MFLMRFNLLIRVRCKFWLAVLLCVAWVCRLGAATLDATFTGIDAGTDVNLTSEGTLDWVHWGLYTATTLTRKATVEPRLPSFEPIGFNGPYQYADNTNTYSWRDGGPTRDVAETPTGVWMFGAKNGFRFEMEAPTTGYGGLERVCASLIDGLIHRGHHVTLFGTGGRTGTRARFVSTNPTLQYPRLLESLPELVHVTQANELIEREQFDIVHDHTTVGPVTASRRRAPSVVTVHGCPTGELNTYLSQVDDVVALVAISHAQRRNAPNLSWTATVHHGIEVDGAVKTRPSKGPVLWLGRFDPDKGPDLALAACREARLPLVLAGKCNQSSEWRYLEEVIKPRLGPDVTLVLNADRARTTAMLAGASALLMSIRWAEPFGMVMIESMALGTPVVALRRGSVPEIVLDGRTGFVCHHESALPDALHKVRSLDPADCAAHVRTSFSVDLMARRYERVYHELVGEREPRTAPLDDVTRSLLF